MGEGLREGIRVCLVIEIKNNTLALGPGLRCACFMQMMKLFIPSYVHTIYCS